MKATRPANQSSFESRKRQRVIAIWRSLGEPKIGENQLRRIQEEFCKAIGERDMVSPAAIARMLADEGAELQHPDVIEFDAGWREARLKSDSDKFSELEPFSGQPLSRNEAETLINEMERLRQRFVSEEDREALTELTRFAADKRRAAESLAKTHASDSARVDQSEIAEWFKVWIQNPTLFDDWLALRKSSTEFRDRFGCEE
jgi:hypothetical protein